METFELDIKILDSIFQNQEVSTDAVKELTQWIKDLDPSFGLLKSLLNQYFQTQKWAGLVKIGKRIQQIVIGLQQKKCPKAFIRAILAVIKTNSDKIDKNINTKMIASKWFLINPQILEYFFDSFNISVDTIQNKQNNSCIKISLQEYQKRIKQLIDKKEYEGAITLIKLIKYPQQYVKLLLNRMSNNKDASKAANIIKNHKIDKKLVPQVGQRLNKNMVRYFYKNYGWEGAQEIFYQQDQAIATLTQDLIFKNSVKEATSLFLRHPGIQKHMKKKESIQFLQNMKKKSKQQMDANMIENPLFKDYFGPSDPTKYISLKELGIERQDVIWIQNEPQLIDKLIEQMRASNIMAIDTQSVVGKTKLQKNKHEKASIVQISFRNKIFIVDGQRCKNQKLTQTLLQYIDSQKTLIGHAIGNDLEAMLLSLGVKPEQIAYVKFKNVIDTNVLFKVIYPKQRYSNLAFICKTVLKKEICKQQTLSNWSRRPLRENQLHYAAMDAFCLINILDVLKEEVGENLLNYYLNRDFD